MKQGLTELGVIMVLILSKTSLVINIMGTSNGGMDNGQVSQKGMMIKVECELQIIKEWMKMMSWTMDYLLHGAPWI